MHVAAYVEQLARDRSAPTAKQRLDALFEDAPIVRDEVAASGLGCFGKMRRIGSMLSGEGIASQDRLE
jgi:hypothetical protein